MDPQLPPQPAPGDEGPVAETQAPQYPEKSLPFGGKPEGSPGIAGDLPNYTQEWNSGEAGPGLSQKPTKWDAIKTSLAQGGRASWLGGTLPELYLRKSAETGTSLSPDQANKLNPYRTTPYTTPVDSGIVAMEAADGYAQQQRAEWLSRNNASASFLSGAARFAGGLTDVPLYAGIALATGPLGELVGAGAEGVAGTVGKYMAQYGWSLGEFSMIGQAQNIAESRMGAARKSIPDVIQENLGGAAIAMGIHAGMNALTRKFFSSGEASPDAVKAGVTKAAAALASDERLPDNSPERAVLGERKAGVTVDPQGEKIQPTTVVSPNQAAKLYGATHTDGTPHVHEAGLGPGVQLVDSKEVANNAVSRAADTPGQIHATALAEGSKLLDIDQPAAADYASPKSLLKAVEEKTGLNLEEDTKNGESVKEVIQRLGDFAGVEIDGKTIPEDILKQAQDIAKEQGYNGYQFKSGDSTLAHIFDPTGMNVSEATHADPSATQPLPNPVEQPPQNIEAAEAAEKQKQQNYSPDAQATLDQIRKTAKTIHPDNLQDQINSVKETLADQKRQLQQMTKDEVPELKEGEEPPPPSARSVAAQEALDQLKEQEVHDKQMLDRAKEMIENCGSSS